MRDGHLGKTILFGSVAGLAGTALLKSMNVAGRKFAPQTMPPMQQDLGEFMVKQAERALSEETREKIPQKMESIAATALGFGYGTTLAALYTFFRHGKTNVVWDGAALGGLTWAIGYLGWLPATELSPPIHKHEPEQIGVNIVSHVMYGIASMAAFDFLRRKF